MHSLCTMSTLNLSASRESAGVLAGLGNVHIFLKNVQSIQIVP